jgi:hypothetical protein
MTRFLFPGQPPSVDDRIVAPESRAEIIQGQLYMSPPAEELHAVPHADLAYILRAHVRAEYRVAVDMLTRSGETSDFAPDASVFLNARNDEGERQLEELAFEIVSEQALAVQTTKARELFRRGVRRIFCLVTKHKRMLEWSGETDAWSATPIDLIEDRCFVKSMPASAILDAVNADDAVMAAMRAKGHPEFERVHAEGVSKGIEKGIAEGIEKGIEKGLRTSIEDLCEALAIPVSTEQRARLAAMNLAELQSLRTALKQNRSWA